MLDITAPPPGRVLSHTKNHLHLLPAPQLRPYIAHYSVTFPSGCLQPGESAPGPLTLIPDLGGCFVYAVGRWRPDVAWGAYSRAVQVPRDFDEVAERFFVEFQPGGAEFLLGMPMQDMTNQMLQTQDTVAEVHKRVRDILDEESGIAAVTARMDSLFLRYLYRRDGINSITGLLPLLHSLETTRPVRELADKSGYSERQLGRIFQQAMGLSVKSASRVVRVNKFIDALRPGVPLAQLAAQAGYYDQAHLNHDFRALCGVSPSEYVQAMSGFYKEQFKL